MAIGRFQDSKVGRISEAPSAIFTPNRTRRYEFPKSGGRRFAFPPYSNAGTLSGTRMSLADRRTFTSPMSAPCVFQSRPAIPVSASSRRERSFETEPARGIGRASGVETGGWSLSAIRAGLVYLDAARLGATVRSSLCGLARKAA